MASSKRTNGEQNSKGDRERMKAEKRLQKEMQKRLRREGTTSQRWRDNT